MGVWSFYEPATGMLTGRRYGGPEAALALNVPAGCAALEGEHDHLSQRIGFEPTVHGDGIDGIPTSPRIIDWQPPQPSEDHEWDGTTRRWVLTAQAADRERRRATARVRIQGLEVAQARRVRELLAESDERLKAIDREIETLRADL